MNKEEILNKYIDLIDKGYCCDCNELNCIDNFPHAKITLAIRELQQENKKYKEVIDKLKTNIKNDIDGFRTINEFGESNEILELLDIYLDILKEVE